MTPHLPFGPTPPNLGALPGVQMTPPAMPSIAPPAVAPLPPQPAMKPSFGDRFKQHLSQLRDALYGTPQGLTGVLSPDEIQNAKNNAMLRMGIGILAGSRSNSIFAPSLGQALAQGLQAGDQSYNQDISTALQQHAAGPQVQAQSAELQRQQEILKNRQQIMQRFPPPTSGSDEDMQKWAQRVYPLLVNSGDFEAAKTLSPLVEKYAAAKAMKLDTPQQTQTGDMVTTFVPGKGFWDPTTKSFVPSLPRGMSADQKAENAQNAALRRMALMSGQQEFQIKDAEQTARAFAARNNLLNQAAQMYVNAKSAIAEAKAGNPAAMHSAILNLAASIDPKAQLRQGTIDFIKHIDSSFHGNVQAWLARAANGNLPPAQLDMMDQLLDRIHADQAAAYERERAGDVKRHPLADAYIPPTEEVFGNVSAPDAAAGSATITPAQQKALDDYIANRGGRKP